MRRKLSIIITVLTIVLSIALVAFLGVKGQPAPQTIRVESVAFVDEEGEKITRNRLNYEKGIETMEVHFKVFPEEATNKNVSLTYNDGNAESNVECLLDLNREGVINIDFKGEMLESFYIRITSLDNFAAETSLRFVAVEK